MNWSDLTTFQKIFIIVGIMLYLVVNESERIETRERLEQFINNTNSSLTEHQDKITLIENHTHHYYDGKPKPTNGGRLRAKILGWQD